MRLFDDLVAWDPRGSEVVWPTHRMPVTVAHTEDGARIAVDMPGVGAISHTGAIRRVRLRPRPGPSATPHARRWHDSGSSEGPRVSFAIGWIYAVAHPLLLAALAMSTTAMPTAELLDARSDDEDDRSDMAREADAARETVDDIRSSRASFQARLHELTRRTARVREAVDIRRRIRENPFAAMGAAFAVGALAGLVRPARPSTRGWDLATVEATSNGLVARIARYVLPQLTSYALTFAYARYDKVKNRVEENSGVVPTDATVVRPVSP